MEFSITTLLWRKWRDTGDNKAILAHFQPGGERNEKKKRRTLRRGFAIEPGQRVLVVEDVVTTGGSVREVLEIVRQAGGEIVGVGSIVDRTGGRIDFGVPFHSVISMEVESYEPSECPLCKAGAPAPYKPGSRKK